MAKKISPEEEAYLLEETRKLAPTHNVAQIAEKLGRGLDFFRKLVRQHEIRVMKWCGKCEANCHPEDFPHKNARQCFRHATAIRDSQYLQEIALQEEAVWNCQRYTMLTATGGPLRSPYVNLPSD